MSLLKKITKAHLKVIQKTVPKNLQPAATKLFSALNPAASFGQFIGEQAECKDFACRREALRRHHERTTTPFSSTNKKSYQADQYLYLSNDPDQIAEGNRLRTEVNASTLKRGSIGLAVASIVVGGAAGAAIGAGGKAAINSGVGSIVDDMNAQNPAPTTSGPGPGVAPGGAVRPGSTGGGNATLAIVLAIAAGLLTI